MTQRRRVKALLAHPGTQYSAQLARELGRLGLLYRFWTGFGVAEGSRWGAIANSIPPLQRALHNRIIPNLSPAQIRVLPSLELGYLAGMRVGGESQSVIHWRNTRFQRAIPERELEACDAGIGFDTSSATLIDRFHRLNKPFALDQTIAHPKAKALAYNLIRERYPEWSRDLEVRSQEVSQAEAAEHQSADRIVVASSFTKSTLLSNGVAAEKISVNPYGVDLNRFRLQDRKEQKPFRFLFAGLISARKGIPQLLEAWGKLNLADAELVLAGPMSHTAPSKWLGASAGVRYVGKVTNAALADLMSESDVFVFPSYFEGFALVLLEAMACGLPIITTTATAGPDLVTEGHDGWIIPPGDLDALVHVMRECSNQRDQVARMRTPARATAERFSWNAFGDRWAGILQGLVQC